MKIRFSGVWFIRGFLLLSLLEERVYGGSCLCFGYSEVWFGEEGL